VSLLFPLLVVSRTAQWRGEHWVRWFSHARSITMLRLVRILYSSFASYVYIMQNCGYLHIHLVCYCGTCRCAIRWLLPLTDSCLYVQIDCAPRILAGAMRRPTEFRRGTLHLQPPSGSIVELCSLFLSFFIRGNFMLSRLFPPRIEWHIRSGYRLYSDSNIVRHPT
jgi:hypothetical protein